MPGLRQTPTTDEIILELRRKIGALERKLTAVIDERRLPGLFSFSGVLDDALGVESPPWRPVHSVKINLLVPQVLVAPSGGNLTIDFTLYGPLTGVVRTVTVLDGTFYTEDAVPFIIPQGGSMTATITASFGASDLAIAALPELL